MAKVHNTPKKRRRRLLTARHKQRMRIKAESATGYLGIYIDDETDRVRIVQRGKRSKFLKRCGNKKVRNSKCALRYGEYRRVFDYWWELT